MKLNFAKACCNIALGMELTEVESKIIQPESSSTKIFKSRSQKFIQSSRNQQGTSQHKPVNKFVGHSKDKFYRCRRPYSETTCSAVYWEYFVCNKKGHISHMCKSKGVHMVDDQDIKESEPEENLRLNKLSNQVVQCPWHISQTCPGRSRMLG